MKKILFTFSMLLVFLLAAGASADTITFTASGLDTVPDPDYALSASATFTTNAGTLTVVLTNTSTQDVVAQRDYLTALFWSGGPMLTPVSAFITNYNLPGGSTYYFDIVSPTPATTSPQGNVGGEWAYAEGFSRPNIPGVTRGIGSAGLSYSGSPAFPASPGIFGPPNFNGPDLDSPSGVDGLNYAITVAGDNLSTGNQTAGTPLIQNSVTFTLTYSGTFDLSQIQNVGFQYGTALTPTDPLITPEPAAMLLFGSGLIGAAAVIRRRFKK